MASDDMKKMLMLIESCSCESNMEDTDEVTEGDEVDEMFFFKDTRSREEKNRDANKPQDILGRRPEQAIARYGKEYKAMKKGTSAQDAADRERYGLGGPEGPLPENFEAFIESIREMAGGQLDEISIKKLRDAGSAAQAAAEKAGSMNGTADEIKNYDAVKTARLAQMKKFRTAANDKEHLEKLSTVASPAMLRKLGIKEEQQAQEDAEFQSFMETLNYVMRKK